jgi:CubicO group peptidase (beta-lactamase class C family)
MKHILVFFWELALLPALASAQEKANIKIYKLFKKELNKKDVHNGFFHLKNSEGTIDWTYAGGEFQDGTPVTQANPFHAASVGKMFTATLIMMLEEQGKLSLTDSLARHLDRDVLKGIHVYNGVDYSGRITLQQLLQHTSGLPDYIMDSPLDVSSNLFSLLLENPDKTWTTQEFLNFTKANLAAHFPPGEGYYYTDTEYVLLGLIIEEHFNAPLAQIFKEELFIPMGMESSFMYHRSEPVKPTARMAEFYIDKAEISSYNSLTLDWAGGGVVTTSADLLKFQQALFAGSLLQAQTLEKMQRWHPESKGTFYGLGLRKYELKAFSKLLPNLTLIGHSGINGSFAFYCPELDVYVAGSFNQTKEMKGAVQFLFKSLTTLYYSR